MQFSIDFLKFIYQHLGLHPLFDKEPEKLANGINPLTGESINDDEIINNVRISRCLFYVKGVLDEVIKNGGVNKSVSKRKKLPFTISNEELANFEFTDEELSISMIVKKINDLQPNEEISKLRASVVISWLVSIGLLYEDNINGRKTKKPTETGKKLGMSLEHRYGMYGEYDITIYNKEAQKFIIDNIEELLNFINKDIN